MNTKDFGNMSPEVGKALDHIFRESQKNNKFCVAFISKKPTLIEKDGKSYFSKPKKFNLTSPVFEMEFC